MGEIAGKEQLEMLPIGACMHCRSLLYLGNTNCVKCGAPIGDSIDFEELQDRVESLLSPQAEIVQVPSPTYGTSARTYNWIYTAMTTAALFGTITYSDSGGYDGST